VNFFSTILSVVLATSAATSNDVASHVKEIEAKNEIVMRKMYDAVYSQPYMYATFPFIPTEAQFRAKLGGTWTNASTFTYNNTNNVTLTRLVFNGNQLTFTGTCDTILIEYCIFKNLGGTLRQIDASGSNIVTIRYCYFENVSAGIYLNAVGSGNSGYNVHHNVFKNMTGTGHVDHRGQSIQFNNINAAANGSRIEYNYMYYDYSAGGDPEDIINIHTCIFTSGDRLLIQYNYIWGPGQYVAPLPCSNPSYVDGPSCSGGGILGSDAGSRYVTVQYNIVNYPGQYGIGLASGLDCIVDNNIVYQTSQNYTNVGIYCYNANGTGCSNNTVSNNRVWYRKSDGSVNGNYTPILPTSGGCTATTITGNNFNDGTVTDQTPPPTESIWWVNSTSNPRRSFY
jgi:hypothetical protein